MLKILITDRAEESLNEIIDFYLTKHTIERTQKVLISIENSFNKITKSPLHFPVCFDVKIPQENIRQFIFLNTFKIIYRLQDDIIEIIELFQGNRNPDNISEID